MALVFHIDQGSYGDVALDELNVVLAAHAPGPMADGNWAVAAYIDERADDQQTAALGAIFTGAEGGPMAAFAPLVGSPARRQEGADPLCDPRKSRSVEIPGIMQMAVEPIPTMHPSGEIWTTLGHPVAPDRLALAVGRRGSSFADSWHALGQFRAGTAIMRRSAGRTSRIATAADGH